MIPRVAVLIPWRPGCPWRERALTWTVTRHLNTLRSVDIILGECNPDRPFNRSEAILTAARHTDADLLVVADGDAWSHGLPDAISAVRHGAPWAIPHLMLHRLTRTATDNVLAGHDIEDQTDFAERPYKGHEAGTMFVISRHVLLDVPPDVRFAAWGQEDDALALALRTLVAHPWRGTAPCWHLWHPPQPRLNRRIGSRANEQLYHRYRQAKFRPDAMRALIDEAKELTSWTPPG